LRIANGATPAISPASTAFLDDALLAPGTTSTSDAARQRVEKCMRRYASSPTFAAGVNLAGATAANPGVVRRLSVAAPDPYPSVARYNGFGSHRAASASPASEAFGPM